jgi:hypothetical protein
VRPCFKNKKIKVSKHLKKNHTAGCWWLMPIILATWEVEKGRISIRGKPRQIARESPSPKLPDQAGREAQEVEPLPSKA